MSEIPRTTPELTDERIDEIFLACGGHYGVSLQGPNQHVFARAILAAQAPAEPAAVVSEDSFDLYTNDDSGVVIKAASPRKSIVFYRDIPVGTLLYTHPKP